MKSFEFLGWLFASQKTGFSGLRYRFIPSLRFGTGFASPYNPCHGLKPNTRNCTHEQNLDFNFIFPKKINKNRCFSIYLNSLLI